MPDGGNNHFLYYTENKMRFRFLCEAHFIYTNDRIRYL